MAKPRKNQRKSPKTGPEPKRVKTGGRQKFEPSDEQRRIVKGGAGFGVAHRILCRMIFDPKSGQPIDAKTLRLHFRRELDEGMANAHFNVGKSLYDQAVGIPKMKDGVQTGWISTPVPVAAIWFSKAQMGWTEKVKLEVADLKAIVAAFGSNVEGLRAFRAALDTEESEE
jgi:hypothetical protein